MKYIFLLFVSFLLFACTNKNGNIENQCITYDTVVVFDTVKLQLSVNKNFTYDKVEDLEKSLEKFYFIVKTKKIDSNYVDTFNKNKIYIWTLQYGTLVDNDYFNEAVILFFLKLYYTSLKEKPSNSIYYGTNVYETSKYDVYLLLLSSQFYRISERYSPMLLNDIYSWVKNSQYTRYEEIKKEVSNIDSLLQSMN